MKLYMCDSRVRYVHLELIYTTAEEANAPDSANLTIVGYQLRKLSL